MQVQAVAAMLGHARPSTSQIYTRVSRFDCWTCTENHIRMHNKIIELVNPMSLVSSAQLVPRGATLSSGNVALAD